MTSILVRDLMTVGVATCKTGTSIREAAQFLLDNHLEELVVINSSGEGAGVCGYEELINVFGSENLSNFTVEAVMREGVPELPADIPVVTAAQLMKDMGIRVAYMNHHAAGITYPAAFISYKHILRCLVANDPQDLKDLGIAASRKSPMETFIQRRDEARTKASLAG